METDNFDTKTECFAQMYLDSDINDSGEENFILNTDYEGKFFEYRPNDGSFYLKIQNFGVLSDTESKIKKILIGDDELVLKDISSFDKKEREIYLNELEKIKLNIKKFLKKEQDITSKDVEMEVKLSSTIKLLPLKTRVRLIKTLKIIFLGLIKDFFIEEDQKKQLKISEIIDIIKKEIKEFYENINNYENNEEFEEIIDVFKEYESLIGLYNIALVNGIKSRINSNNIFKTNGKCLG